jgi:hypothetical protein
MRALPRPTKRKKWQRIDSFSIAEEVLNDPTLKSVFKTAIDNGCAVAAAKANEKWQHSRSDTGITGQHPDRKRSISNTPTERADSRGPEDSGEVRETVDKTLLSFQDLGPDSVAHLRRTLGLPSSGRDSGGRRSGFSLKCAEVPGQANWQLRLNGVMIHSAS